MLTTCNSDDLKWIDKLEPIAISINKFCEHVSPNSPLHSKPVNCFSCKR